MMRRSPKRRGATPTGVGTLLRERLVAGRSGATASRDGELGNRCSEDVSEDSRGAPALSNRTLGRAESESEPDRTSRLWPYAPSATRQCVSVRSTAWSTHWCPARCFHRVWSRRLACRVMRVCVPCAVCRVSLCDVSVGDPHDVSVTVCAVHCKKIRLVTGHVTNNRLVTLSRGL